MLYIIRLTKMLYLPSIDKLFKIFPIIENVPITRFQWFNFYLMMPNLIEIMIACWWALLMNESARRWSILMFSLFDARSVHLSLWYNDRLIFLSFRKTNQRTRWHVCPFRVAERSRWKGWGSEMKDRDISETSFWVRATEEECHILPSYHPSETLIYNTSAAIEYRKILKHLI